MEKLNDPEHVYTTVIGTRANLSTVQDTTSPSY